LALPKFRFSWFDIVAGCCSAFHQLSVFSC
jgi:hypothetical protein